MDEMVELVAQALYDLSRRTYEFVPIPPWEEATGDQRAWSYTLARTAVATIRKIKKIG